MNIWKMNHYVKIFKIIYFHANWSYEAQSDIRSKILFPNITHVIAYCRGQHIPSKKKK